MSHPDTQLGWKAELTLSFEKAAQKTLLSKRSQSGPLTVQRPFYPEDDVCHLYILHPPGGVVGGDELHINVELNKQASVLITTPGATKFYRNTGQLARQCQHLQVADGCALEWFPQENIFFDETHTHLSTRVDLEKEARFMGWEINCYGRPASQALFEKGLVMTRLDIYRDQQPLLLDRLLINDKHTLQAPNSVNGFPCFGTFIATHANQELLEKARLSLKHTPQNGQIQYGLTLIDDLLIARCLGQHAEQVSTTLKAIWATLRPDVMQRPVCLPRIWAT